ncbi:MAG: hypothetical protein KA715_09760 [Xanthomonadaceae bacterium]|nr:hypothetical protein [Xanthomonadaceae bacterium]
MKTKMMLVTGIVLISSFSAQAGREGHGGIAVVCRDAKDRITYAELLDVFEVEQDPELNWNVRKADPNENDPWAGIYDLGTFLVYKNEARTQFRESVGAVDSPLYMLGVDLFHYHKKIMKNSIYAKLDSKVRRALPKDFNPRFTKEGCPFEVAAYYDKATTKTVFDSEIFFALPYTSQSALYAHEALYWAARDNFGASTSDEIRPIVGLLNSSLSESEKIKILLDPEQKLLSLKAVLGESLYQNAAGDFLQRRIISNIDENYESQLAREQLIRFNWTDDWNDGSMFNFRFSIHNHRGDTLFDGSMSRWFSIYLPNGNGYMDIGLNPTRFGLSIRLNSVVTKDPIFEWQRKSSKINYEVRAF